MRARTSIGKSKQQPDDPAQVQEQGSSSTCVSHGEGHVDLYLSNEMKSHYVWIKNLNRLMSGQYRDGHTDRGMHLCRRCLNNELRIQVIIQLLAVPAYIIIDYYYY